MSANFGVAAEDYAIYRAGFPDSFFDRLARCGVGGAGSTVVDVGTGTGTLARGFARRGARVIGIDPDERLLQQARRLDAVACVAVEYKVGTAEQLPLADASTEIVAAGQCWHWFDGGQAAAEFARIVKPGGRVVVAHFDWLPLPGSVVEATEGLIMKFNPRWHLGGGNGFHLESVPHLYAAGFRDFESFSYDLDVPYTPAAWRGRIRASAGVGASLTPAEVDAFDQALARLLASLQSETLQMPHRVFAIVATAARAS